MRSLKEIDDYQIKSISLIKAYLKKCTLKNINISTSPFCDFVTWADGLGNQNLKQLINPRKVNFKLIYFYLIEFISVAKLNNYSTIFPKIKNNNKNIKVIVSYCKKSYFTRNGTFKDPYFNLTNNNKNIFWFLLSLDNYIPVKKKNLFIIYKKKDKYNWFFLISMIIKNLLTKNFFYRFNNTSLFSQFVADIFEKIFDKKKIDLYLPYENRPFQNAIINSVKKMSNGNKTFAYLHNLPWPFQADMIYKNKNIDTLYVCSNLQKQKLINYYDWSKNKIKTTSSLRYSKLSSRKSTIFLPYEINNEEIYLSNLLLLFKEKKFCNINLNISIHPLKKNNKKHIEFKNVLKKSIAKIKDINKYKIKIFNSILIGAPGGAAAECLQTTGKIFHITINKYDVFSVKIWTNIKVKNFSKYMYEYTLIKKINFIDLAHKKNNLKEKILNESKK